MASVEFLNARRTSMRGQRMLDALKLAVSESGDEVNETTSYQGKSDWLILFGIGAPEHDAARNKQRRVGHTLHVDLGYTNRDQKLRICIDEDHPHKWFPKTIPGCFADMDISLRNTFDPNGKVIIVGFGRKSRRYLNAWDWEKRIYKKLRAEFPNREIMFRPKGRDTMTLPCRMDSTTPFHTLVDGSSLVVARHSNCCIDAIVAGIPFRAEYGAAVAFDGDREKFLGKLARWQYRPDQAAEAWKFAKEIVREAS